MSLRHETSKFFLPTTRPLLFLMERHVAVPIEPLEFYLHSILMIERELQRIETMDEALLDLQYFLEDYDWNGLSVHIQTIQHHLRLLRCHLLFQRQLRLYICAYDLHEFWIHHLHLPLLTFRHF